MGANPDVGLLSTEAVARLFQPFNNGNAHCRRPLKSPIDPYYLRALAQDATNSLQSDY